jgi:UDP-N-acetylmuramoyl-tripeptide--D-alanyl-D-alanine ligase
MKSLTVKQLIDIIGGKLIKGSNDLEIEDATPYIEYMKKPNTLLFLLRKWKVKWDLLYKCDPCVVVTDKIFIELLKFERCTLIKVDNIENAYQKYIDFYRNQFDIPVVAVTGTSGKSTTVGMIEYVLSKYLKTVATRNSANGRTGHFKYLMELDDSTEAAVFEAAVEKPGDVTNACKYYKPRIGIITNIGTYHLNGCGTQEGYINAKGEMLTSIKENGVLIINSDDELTKRLPLNQFNGKIITVGVKQEAAFRASDIRYEHDGMSFTLNYNKQAENFYVPGLGTHQVYNALQTIAALTEIGIGFQEIKETLKTYKKLPLRLELRKGLNNCTLLNDCWNVADTSLKAALIAMDGISQGRKKVVLLGELHQTGEYTEEIAAKFSELFMNYGRDINTLITVGSTAEMINAALVNRGFYGSLYAFPDVQGIYDLLLKILDEKTIFLVKIAFEDYLEFTESLIID